MGHGAVPKPDPRKPGPLPPSQPPSLPADDTPPDADYHFTPDEDDPKGLAL